MTQVLSGVPGAPSARAATADKADARSLKSGARRSTRHPGWRRWTTAVAAAAAALFAAGCGSAGGTATAAATSSAAQTPTSGGNLVFAVNEVENSLNPAYSALDVTGVIDRNIFDSLVVQTGPDSFGPWLATHWTISPDGKTYTFTLRRGVTFQDGTPFNAAAVKASLDYVVNPATKSMYAASLIAPYASSTAVNDYTVEVRLSKPDSAFLQSLSTPFLGIQSPTELAKAASEYIPVGSGPFKYEAWNQNENVILERAATYNSPPANATHKGPAYVGTLTFQFIAADDTRYGALTSGQVTAIEDVPPIDVKSLSESSGFYVQTEDNPGLGYNLFLNVTNGVLSNENVRRAFIESVDVPALINSTYFGDYKAATNPLSPTTAFYDVDAKSLPYDPADAVRLLAAAGYTKVNPAGYRVNSKGQELTVVWPYTAETNREERDVLGSAIVAEAKAVGINLARPSISLAQLGSDYVSGDYAILDYSFTSGSADILRYAFADMFSDGGGDLSRIQDSELTSWLDGGAATTDAGAQEQDYDNAQRYVLDNAVVLPLYTEESQLGASDKLHGISYGADGSPLFYSAWLSS
jgi:peptide/nickel transport system substrate-binding protein